MRTISRYCLSILAVLLMSVPATAQQRQSDDFDTSQRSSQRQRKPRRLEFGLDAGMHFTQLSVKEGSGVTLSGKAGFTAAMHIAVRMGAITALQPEIVYSYMKADIALAGSPATHNRLRLNTFQVPIMLRADPLRWLGLQVGPVITVAENNSIDTDLKNSVGNFCPTLSYAAGITLRISHSLTVTGRYYGTFNRTVNAYAPTSAAATEFRTLRRGFDVRAGINF